MSENGVNGWQSTEAGQALQARLGSEVTLMALTRLLDRIDSLEKTVVTLTEAVNQAPGMVAMVGDMADEAVGNAAKRGVDVEERLRTAMALAEKLTAPKTAAQIDQLLALADQAPGVMAMVGDMADEAIGNAAKRGVDVEQRFRAGLTMLEKLTEPKMMAQLDQLMALADQAPGIVAMVGDMADEAIGNAAKRGVDVEQRLRAGVAMLEKLTEPKMMAQLDQLMALGEQAPGIVAMVGDMADEAIGKMHANGIDLEERLQVGLMAAERLTSPEMAGALPVLTDGNLINVLGMTGEALKEGMAMPERKVGAFGLLRELNNPDMQRGLSLLLNFGKAFGRKLKK